MLVHVVLLKFKSETSSEHIDQVVREIGALPQRIEEIRDYRVSRDMGLASDNADVAIIGHFDNEADYRAYSADPTHRRIIEDLILPHLADRSAAQFTI